MTSSHDDTPGDSAPDGEPPRMEIDLSITGMDPEVEAAMRERIQNGTRRWDNIRPQAEPFVANAVDQPASPARNQHYISRFWLRLFQRQHKVAVLDIADDPCSEDFGPSVPVRRAAAADRLFTLSGEDSSAHEAMMGYIEGKAAPIFKKMADGQPPVDDFERFVMSMYLAFVFLQAPETMRFSDAQAKQHIAKLARGIQDDYGVDPGDIYDLDALEQSYTFSALFGRPSLINKLGFFFFCRNWHLVGTPESWPLALPMFPIINWGQGLLTARDVSIVLSPNRLLVMSWPTLSDPEALTDKQCIAICDALIRHAAATDGRLIVHPDHVKHWGRGIQGHQQAPAPGPRPESPLVPWAGHLFEAQPSGILAPPASEGR